MPDGDGTMLDHSLFLYGSNMSNSNAHNHYPLPTSIVGGWKTVKGGQHVVPPEHTPLANVLLTLLDRSAIAQDKIGRQHRARLVERVVVLSARACRCALSAALVAADHVDGVAIDAQRTAERIDARGSIALAAQRRCRLWSTRLLKAGANPNVRNQLGSTPLSRRRSTRTPR